MLKQIILAISLVLVPAASAGGVDTQPIMLAQADASVASTGLSSDPSTVSETVDSAGELVDAVRSGSWIGIASTLIMLLLNLLRLPLLGGLTNKIPKRWRTAIPVFLGGIAGILASIMAGVPISEAILVGLLTGPTAIAQHETIKNLILNKRA